MELQILNFDNSIALVGLILSVTAILFTAHSVARNTKVEGARFWLELRGKFSEFDDVHSKLRPGGEWAGNNSGPVEQQEWIRVEAYMGLFEHCNCMLNDKLIDQKTFKKIYSYRLNNIVNNKIITDAKLRDPGISKYWKDFIELLERFEIKYK